MSQTIIIGAGPAGLTPVSRNRRSLIYYRDRLFQYPFSLTNALKHLGPIDVSLTGLSYLATWLNEQAVFPDSGQSNEAERDFESAEGWLTRRFGAHLYRIFWASYFYKRWGQPADRLQTECAREMIADIFGSRSLMRSLVNTAFNHRQIPADQNPTLVKIIEHTSQQVERIFLPESEDSEDVLLAANNQVVPSLPLASVVKKRWPPASTKVIAAADGLQYRSLVTVILVIDQNSLFSEHEIHIHSPDMKVSYIQNLKSLCLKRGIDDQKTYLGMAYWCEASDYLWEMREDRLVQLATRELIALRLIHEEGLVESGSVVRYADVELVHETNDYARTVEHTGRVQTCLKGSR
ncbi:MAG: hypothetical protein WA883_01695 [Phormidesmis sp.]